MRSIFTSQWPSLTLMMLLNDILPVPVRGKCPRSGWAPLGGTAEEQRSQESRDWLAGPGTERHCCPHLTRSSLLQLWEKKCLYHLIKHQSLCYILWSGTGKTIKKCLMNFKIYCLSFSLRTSEFNLQLPHKYLTVELSHGCSADCSTPLTNFREVIQHSIFCCVSTQDYGQILLLCHFCC